MLNFDAPRHLNSKTFLCSPQIKQLGHDRQFVIQILEQWNALMYVKSQYQIPFNALLGHRKREFSAPKKFQQKLRVQAHFEDSRVFVGPLSKWLQCVPSRLISFTELRFNNPFEVARERENVVIDRRDTFRVNLQGKVYCTAWKMHVGNCLPSVKNVCSSREWVRSHVKTWSRQSN